MNVRKAAMGIFFLTLIFVLSDMPAMAASTRASYPIIATGKQREQIKATPITKRPYRPLHFYGNSVRRAHHRRAR
jgi:hypothetical protein